MDKEVMMYTSSTKEFLETGEEIGTPDPKFSRNGGGVRRPIRSN